MHSTGCSHNGQRATDLCAILIRCSDSLHRPIFVARLFPPYPSAGALLNLIFVQWAGLSRNTSSFCFALVHTALKPESTSPPSAVTNSNAICPSQPSIRALPPTSIAIDALPPPPALENSILPMSIPDVSVHHMFIHRHNDSPVCLPSRTQSFRCQHLMCRLTTPKSTNTKVRLFACPCCPSYIKSRKSLTSGAVGVR